MLVEKSLSDALKAFDKGKDVLVLSTMIDGSISCDKMADFFLKDTRFLVDVPAVENPKFEAAVQNMVRHGTARESEEPSGGAVTFPEEMKQEPKETKQTTKEIIAPLVKKGLSASEIAKRTGLKYATVYAAMNPDKCKSKKIKVEERPVN